MATREEIREGMLHEICCICVHKPTSIKDGLFKDSAKTLKGCGCTYHYDEESNQYCALAYKVAKAIMSKLHSQGVVIKVAEISDDLAQTASETPKYFAQGKDMAFISTERTFHIYEAFKKAGYVAVEPLIKEAI